MLNLQKVHNIVVFLPSLKKQQLNTINHNYSLFPPTCCSSVTREARRETQAVKNLGRVIIPYTFYMPGTQRAYT